MSDYFDKKVDDEYLEHKFHKGLEKLIKNKCSECYKIWRNQEALKSGERAFIYRA